MQLYSQNSVDFSCFMKLNHTPFGAVQLFFRAIIFYTSKKGLAVSVQSPYLFKSIQL